MDEDDVLPLPRALRRRARRRAERAVDNAIRIQHLRNQLLNQNYDSSDSSVYAQSEGSDGADSSEGPSDHEDVPRVDEQLGDIGPDGEEVNLGIEDDVNVDERVEEAEVVRRNDSDAEDDLPGVLNDEEKEDYVIQCLKEWASSGGVLSMRKVDELLSKLSFVYPRMPKSYKVLLKSKKKSDVFVGEDFKFWYKGLRVNLDHMNLDRYLEKFEQIVVDINMDGLPLSGDKGIKFWPILGRLVNTDDQPFIIAIYCGASDPRDLDMYLGDFVFDVNDLQTNGYVYNDVQYRVIVRNFILDAVARSFIKCCIGHGGYGACEKCTVVGSYARGRVNFSEIGANCRARTDESYANREDRLHHSGRSPLELIGVGMVSQFRLDTMHLLYKGTFSRYLEAVLTWEGDWNPSNACIGRITAKLLGFINSCPRDFNRKPRKLQDWHRYKATELRRMLLYDGVVAFKDEFDDNIYQMFLLLHSAIYILASPYLLPLFLEEARVFIDNFVEYSGQVFGSHFVSYNVHSTKHVADECANYGVVESFSTFPYENCLKSIKEMLRSGYLPLEQIVMRDSERTERKEVILKNEINLVEVFQPNEDEEEDIPGRHFKRICVNNVTLKIDGRDSCFMTTGGNVVLLQNIIQTNENTIVLSGKRFTQHDNAYTYPIDSTRLGVYRVWELSARREAFPLSTVFAKCWLIQDGDTFVSMPLFVLVEFESLRSSNETDDDDPPDTFLEVACSKWLRMNNESGDLECLWPPGKLNERQLTRLVTSRVDADAKWIPYKCSIVKSYDTYLKAHLGSKNREKQADYETEKELGFGRRKKKPRTISSDEEDDQSSQHVHVAGKEQIIGRANSMPAPPQINVPVGNNKGPMFQAHTAKSPVKVVINSNAGSSRTASNAKTLKAVRQNKKGTTAESLNELKRIVQAKKEKATHGKEAKVICTSPSWKVKPPENSNEPDKGQNSSPPVMPVNSPSSVFGDGVDPQDDIFTEDSQLTEYENNDKSPRNRVTKKLFSPEKIPATSSVANFERMVLVSLKELNEKAEMISANQSKLNLHLLPSERVISRPKGMPTLPLKSLAQVEKMESCLKNDENISDLACYLSANVSCKPEDEYDSAKKVMSKLLDNSVAKHFNFEGRRGSKSGFKDLALWKAVQGAIMWKVESTNCEPTKKAVMNWLSNAPWRSQSDGSSNRRPRSADSDVSPHKNDKKKKSGGN